MTKLIDFSDITSNVNCRVLLSKNGELFLALPLYTLDPIMKEADVKALVGADNCALGAVNPAGYLIHHPELENDVYANTNLLNDIEEDLGEL